MALAGSSSAYNLNSITAQISESVQRIKTASLNRPEISLPSENYSGESSGQSFSLHNFAISYLEPRALYSLQRMISEAPEQMNKDGRSQLKADNKEQKSPDNIKTQAFSEADFNNELEQIFSAADYAKVTAVYRRAVRVDVPEVTLLFGGSPVSEDPARYAANAYNTAAELNHNKEPLIELMHDNNRKFDYKI